MKFEVLEIFEARELERVRRAIQWAAVHDENSFGVLGFDHEAFDATADTGQTGHLSRAIARQFTNDAVGDFTGIRATGTGINDGRPFRQERRGKFRQDFFFFVHATTMPLRNESSFDTSQTV